MSPQSRLPNVLVGHSNHLIPGVMAVQQHIVHWSHPDSCSLKKTAGDIRTICLRKALILLFTWRLSALWVTSIGRRWSRWMTPLLRKTRGTVSTMIMVATQQAPRHLLLLGVQEKAPNNFSTWPGSIAGWRMFLSTTWPKHTFSSHQGNDLLGNKTISPQVRIGINYIHRYVVSITSHNIIDTIEASIVNF